MTISQILNMKKPAKSEDCSASSSRSFYRPIFPFIFRFTPLRILSWVLIIGCLIPVIFAFIRRECSERVRPQSAHSPCPFAVYSIVLNSSPSTAGSLPSLVISPFYYICPRRPSEQNSRLESVFLLPLSQVRKTKKSDHPLRLSR